jgi:tRNA-dihydrouridine synthase
MASPRSRRASPRAPRPSPLAPRSGFDDTSLFEQNLLAAQEAGAAFVTIHPRTKRQKYEGRADWSLITRARQLLRVPVVGAVGAWLRRRARRRSHQASRCAPVPCSHVCL